MISRYQSVVIGKRNTIRRRVLSSLMAKTLPKVVEESEWNCLQDNTWKTCLMKPMPRLHMPLPDVVDFDEDESSQKRKMDCRMTSGEILTV